jgi:hypothetical protein
MGNYGQMRRQARQRKKTLEKQLAAAEKAVRACEGELSVIDQILDALAGGRGGAGRGRMRGGRRGGKWRPGRPGRPPNWYIEQQKAKGKRGKRRGRRAAKPAAAPAAG